MSKRRSRRDPRRRNGRYLVVVGGLAVAVVIIYLVSSYYAAPRKTETSIGTSSASSSFSGSTKPVILYVNQGNGGVNGSNFGDLLATATSHSFNTVFFQVYRSGTLLFTDASLSQFASEAHANGLKLFFALYFTDASQKIPSSIYADGEDGINLDMSMLPIDAQTTLFNNLSNSYPGTTAITTTNPTLSLAPGLLILETYGSGNEQYIHHGIIASVGVFATSSQKDYLQQFQYDLSNSDGVMVFDYAGLVKAGY